MSWKVESVAELRGYTVEWAEEGNYYLSKRNVLYRSADLKAPFTKIAEIEAPLIKRAASTFRLAQRLLRFMVTNVVPLGNGDLFVSFDKSVGVVSGGRYRRLEGLVRPCRILRGACAADASGDIYFGEYLANTERGEMRIYRYAADEGRLEVAHTFPAGSIRHIHGVYFDERTGYLYCLTGDADAECRILRSRDGFRTTETVGAGDESWRAVSVLFDADALYYGTDAEYRTNNIFRLDRATGGRRDLGEVGGTVFYSKRFGGGLFFATTAENAPSQTENVAALFCLEVSPSGSGERAGREGEFEPGGPEELVRFEKDFWNPTLFMFGTIHFPYANLVHDRLFFHVVGVKGDNGTFVVSKR